MAELKVSRFCSLATSTSWHTWLHNYDHKIYQDFIRQFKLSTGCQYNRELMVETLKKIDQRGGRALLIEFAKVHHPYTLEDEGNKPDNKQIFPGYVPGILTYPRRIILTGEPGRLEQLVRDFLVDKYKYDYVVVGDKAYIEYLLQQDVEIADQIAASCWYIANYRKNKL